MPILYYHGDSDSLFVEQYEVLDWSHIEPCEDVSCEPWAVERYNREVPGYKVHLYSDREDGLAHCLTCGAGECELTTDCPGHRVSDSRREEVCAGNLDYWSGVWLLVPRITDKDLHAATVNPDGETYDGRKLAQWLFEAVTGKPMSNKEAEALVAEAKQLAKDRKK